MKVLLIEYFLPETLYIVELAKPLSAYADVSIFCKETSTEDIAPGIRLIPEYHTGGNKLVSPLKYLYSLHQLKKEILHGGYDVIHSSSFKKASVEIKLISDLRPHIKKLVHTVHNVLPHESSQQDIKLWGDFYDLCDELIVHNEVTKSGLIKTFHIPENKIHVIAHGEFNSYPVSHDITFRKADKIRFTQLGLIRKYKGVDVFLNAIALLDKETRSKALFTIIGRQFQNMDDTNYDEIIHRLGIEDCVRFIPERVEDPDIPKLYDETDIAVFPYKNIYGSGILLMAYTFRKPVIVSDIPALMEEIDNGKTGLSFHTEDPADLAKTIQRAVNWSMEDYQTYVENINELTEVKFNWQVSAKKTYEVYMRGAGI